MHGSVSIEHQKKNILQEMIKYMHRPNSAYFRGGVVENSYFKSGPLTI